MRRRIVFLITELSVGGAERCLVQLATGLDRERFEPFVVSIGPPPPPERDALVRQLAESEVPTEFLGCSSAWQFCTALWRWRRTLRRLEPDVVQTFLFHANVLGALGRSRGRWVAGVRVADPRRWRQRVEGRALRRADAVACVSQSVADFVRRTAGVAESRLVAIPNSVDIDRFARAEPLDKAAAGLDPSRRWLLFVGRLDRQKGLDELLRHAPRLFERLPLHDLVLVGDGPQRDELARQADRDGLGSRVHFVGWQSDVERWLAAADLLLLPSRWEGMPNVLLEAMAAGRPVVVTRVEGVTEILGPLAAEQTTEPGDGAAFVDRLIVLATDHALAQRLGADNRQRAASEFTPRRLFVAYEHLYESR